MTKPKYQNCLPFKYEKKDEEQITIFSLVVWPKFKLSTYDLKF